VIVVNLKLLLGFEGCGHSQRGSESSGTSDSLRDILQPEGFAFEPKIEDVFARQGYLAFVTAFAEPIDRSVPQAKLSVLVVTEEVLGHASSESTFRRRVYRDKAEGKTISSLEAVGACLGPALERLPRETY
jgi:hypothetical protein